MVRTETTFCLRDVMERRRELSYKILIRAPGRLHEHVKKTFVRSKETETHSLGWSKEFTFLKVGKTPFYPGHSLKAK